MVEYNYFKTYYQKPSQNFQKSNWHVDKCANAMSREKRYSGPSDKQAKFHNNLLEFLKNKGQDVKLFSRPRNQRECHSQINAMNTILRKNGWLNEFYGKEIAE